MTATLRLRDPRLVDLPSAIDWLREHWDNQRPAPTRLTVNDTEGELGGLRYSGAFAATLGWTPTQSTRITFTATCYHPMANGRPDQCPECSGIGVKEQTSDRYIYPMSSALEKLRREVVVPARIPSLAVIYALASASFRPAVALRLLNATDEAILLRAIRVLFHNYQAGPVATTPWTELSESQRNAVLTA